MLKTFYGLYGRRLYTYRSLEQRTTKTFDKNLRGGLQIKYTTTKNYIQVVRRKI